jgi:hypothetical protein
MTVFEKLASEIGLGPVETEYQFAQPRKWRFDYAWVGVGVALEVEGGTWRKGGGAHRGTGFLRDLEKYNEAVCQGWRIIRCTPQQRDSGEILETLRRLV